MHVPGPRPSITTFRDHGARWTRAMLCGGALLGLATVAMGALAAHLPDRMLAAGGRELLRSAVQMQGWHVAALLATGLLLERQVGDAGRWLLRLAGVAFGIGIACFCGGVYALGFAVGQDWARVVGHAAPVGGSLLMLGWLLLALGCVGRRRG